MVEMGVADQQDFDIAKLESKLFYARSNEWNTLSEIGVDEDVSGGCRYQVAREIAAADVIEIAGDPERGKWVGPSGIALPVRVAGDNEQSER
jgi:hypothetical protein